MATAPVPPYKPTPPTPPVVPGTTTTGSPNSQPVQQTQTAPAAPAKSPAAESLQKFEDMGKAFQGQTAQPPAAANSAPPAGTSSTQTGQTVQKLPAAAATVETEQAAAQTLIPAKSQLPDKNTNISSLYGWCFAAVVIVALVLVGLRFFKTNRSPAPLTTAAKPPKAQQPVPAMDITTASQDAASKPKSSFEVRV